MTDSDHDNIPDEPVKNYLAVTIDYRREREVHCAHFRQDKRLLEVCHFLDNQHFSNLQSLLIQLNPKENDFTLKIYLHPPTIETQKEKLNEKFQEIDVTPISLKTYRQDKSHDSVFAQILKKPLSNYHRHMKNELDMSILFTLVEQLKLNDETNKKSIELDTMNLLLYMKLDNSAIQSLQLLPKKMQKRVMISNETIFDMLNRCKTAIGTRCLKRWMKQPLQKPQAIEYRLQFLQYFLDNPDIRKLVQTELLNHVCDLDKLYFTFYKVHSQKPAKIEMSQLLRLYKFIKALNTFTDHLERKKIDDFGRKNILQRVSEGSSDLDKPKEMIENNIVMVGSESQYHVKPSTQANLKKLQKQKDEILRQVHIEEKEIQAELDIECQRTTSTAQLFLLEAEKGPLSQAIRNNEKYKIMTVRGKKATFTSTRLMNLCADMNKLNEQYRKEEKDVLKRMFNVIASYYEILERLSEVIAELDVITTYASVVSLEPNRWTRPKITNKLVGKDMVHPCLSECIPNDCQMDQDKTYIITGPNMGGKSTYIRTVGVCVYLTHIGFFVPAKMFQTPIIDAIITRVGASDVQLKGISTFMSEMLDTACMLKTATKNSLVLIDELGRGTSTHEGLGIAWAICQYLHQKINPYCLFATHFHEMTKMPQEVAGVRNMFADCTLENGKLKMEYRIRPGKISRSYGIDLAESIGLPLEVTQNARKFAEGLEKFEDEVVNSRQRKSEKMEVENEGYSLAYETKLKMIDMVNREKEKYGGIIPPERFQEVRRNLKSMMIK